MDDAILKALRQIKQTRATIVVKREDVDHLINEGLADEADGHLFLTEAGGAALEREERRRKCGAPDPDESHSPEVGGCGAIAEGIQLGWAGNVAGSV